MEASLYKNPKYTHFEVDNFFKQFRFWTSNQITADKTLNDQHITNFCRLIYVYVVKKHNKSKVTK